MQKIIMEQNKERAPKIKIKKGEISRNTRIFLSKLQSMNEREKNKAEYVRTNLITTVGQAQSSNKTRKRK